MIYPTVSFIKHKPVVFKPEWKDIPSPRQMPMKKWEWHTCIKLRMSMVNAMEKTQLLNSLLMLQYVTRHTYKPNRFEKTQSIMPFGYSFTDYFVLRTIKEKAFYIQMHHLFPALFHMYEGMRMLYGNFVPAYDFECIKKQYVEWLAVMTLRIKNIVFQDELDIGNYDIIYYSLLLMELADVPKKKLCIEL